MYANKREINVYDRKSTTKKKKKNLHVITGNTKHIMTFTC